MNEKAILIEVGARSDNYASLSVLIHFHTMLEHYFSPSRRRQSAHETSNTKHWGNLSAHGSCHAQARHDESLPVVEECFGRFGFLSCAGGHRRGFQAGNRLGSCRVLSCHVASFRCVSFVRASRVRVRVLVCPHGRVFIVLLPRPEPPI